MSLFKIWSGDSRKVSLLQPRRVAFHRGKKGSQVVWQVHYTCNEGCSKTANLEDVLDIYEKHLSSKDEGPELLRLAARGKREFWLF